METLWVTTLKCAHNIQPELFSINNKNFWQKGSAPQALVFL